LNRIPRSSLGNLKPKHLQQSFITTILDVLNNFSGANQASDGSELNADTNRLVTELVTVGRTDYFL